MSDEQTQGITPDAEDTPGAEQGHGAAGDEHAPPDRAKPSPFDTLLGSDFARPSDQPADGGEPAEGGGDGLDLPEAPPSAARDHELTVEAAAESRLMPGGELHTRKYEYPCVCSIVEYTPGPSEHDKPDGQWWPAIVTHVHADGSVNLNVIRDGQFHVRDTMPVRVDHASIVADRRGPSSDRRAWRWPYEA
jgi:hypothetical protein